MAPVSSTAAAPMLLGSFPEPRSERARRASEPALAGLPKGGGPNRTADQYRAGLTTGLDSAAVRQEENMYLALRPEVLKRYPVQIQRLLGWSYMPETYMGWVEIRGEMADPIRLLE